MTIHYHGTPITPRSVMQTLAGKDFCVSFAAPQDVEYCHEIGQSVMLDNGAFSFWRSGQPQTNWEPYYRWCSHWLKCRTTWAVIPDVIDGSEVENDALIDEWDERMGTHIQGSPVWHIHESYGRLWELIHVRQFSRVCFGSSGEYATIGTDKWNQRMNAVFNYLGTFMPCQIHMLRGMSLAGSIYPFASVDSTDVARNHNRPQNTALEMANRWNALQCPMRWKHQPLQQQLVTIGD